MATEYRQTAGAVIRRSKDITFVQLTLAEGRTLNRSADFYKRVVDNLCTIASVSEGRMCNGSGCLDSFRGGISSPVAGCWFHPSPKSNSSCLVAGCCEACGQPPTCGQGGGNALRFPRLVHRGPRLRGQAGIGAADCPQIHSTCSAWRQAASAVAAIDWLR